MKRLIFILLITVYYPVFTQNITKIDDFGENKGNLKMYTYFPENLPSNQKIPLVLVLHGCTQSAHQIAKETGWNKLADSLHFIVVYPEQKQINNVTKCFNFFIGYMAKKDQGEVASIRQMIDYCFNHYKIDRAQVFITGMSAGGGMSNAMLNAYPELFNAGALLGAPSTLAEVNTAPLTLQPKIAILQGKEDKIVPQKHAEKNLEHWLNLHQINSEEKIVVENYQGHHQLVVEYYKDEKETTQVVLLWAKEVAHKILINPGEEIKKGGEKDFHTEEIGFHSTYWIADFFGLVK